MDEAILARVHQLTARFHLRPGRQTAEDAAAFVGLMNAQYARKVAADYYFWQFFQAPSPRLCLLAELEGRVVAASGLWILPFRAPQDCRLALVTDLIIAPEFRRTGLFLRLELELERAARKAGCVGMYAAPNEAAYHPRITSLDWKPLPARAAWAALTAPGPEVKEVEIEPLTRFGHEASLIAARFLAHDATRILCRREPEYLNWRLGANPRYRYDLFCARRAAEPFGYLALKVFKDPQTSNAFGDIVDLLWAEEAPETLDAMLRFARAHFHAQGVERATIWLQTGTLLDQVAPRAGFTPTDQRRHFCCKVLDPDYSWLAEDRRWFITMLDAEIF